MRRNRRPLVVCNGVGRNSVAMLVEMNRLGIRPDLILHADTGGEKPETVEYLPYLNEWLRSIGFPETIVVRYEPKTADYTTLEEQCLKTKYLPALAYGGRSCSLKYKRYPQDKYIKSWGPAIRCWEKGQRVIKAIGYDAGEEQRFTKAAMKEAEEPDQKYEYWYPLHEWGWELEDCIEAIEDEGLRVPAKSSCFF